MKGPRFIGSEIYRHSSYGGGHPLRIPRVSTVMDLSRALGWLPGPAYVTSPRARAAALAHWHDTEYLDALQRAERTQTVSAHDTARHGLGTASNPVFPEMFRRPATAAGGSILAGEMLTGEMLTGEMLTGEMPTGGGVVFHPAGGTHHGMPGRANGFCYLNDSVLGILSLRARGVRRIAYVDIDAHHPDGVEHAFHGDRDVLMISVHEEGLWPRTGLIDQDAGGSAINLPVPRGFHDDEMAFAVEELIGPAVQRFAPDAVVLQCGADGLEEDPQAHLSLSNRAHLGVVAALRGLSPRFLVLGGGGYNPWSVGRLWTAVWGTLAGHTLPDRLPDEAEAVLRGLRFPGNRRGRNPPGHWFTTLIDAPRGGPVRDSVRARVATIVARPAPGL